mgnify:CR=1 FL=1
MPSPSEMPAVCQARNTKAVSIHIRTLAAPMFEYSRAIAMAKMIYGNIGVAFNIASEMCPSLDTTSNVDLSEVNGMCAWNQFNPEQSDLYSRAHPGSGGVTVFIVGAIRETPGNTLAGCAGHAPGKPTAVVSAAAGTIYTIAHEVGHVLLGSAYSPVHATDIRNIMIGGTWQIPANAIPYFTEGQRQQILRNPLLRAL